MKKLFIILVAGIFSFSGFSQVEEGAEKEKKMGPNKTHFIHNHFSLGFMMPMTEGEGADILYGKSHTFTYGVRYKYRIADFFALGAGINYTSGVWHMDQVDTKVVPVESLYDKEKIKTNNLGGDIFLRFNIGKRINTVGNYIDFGGYGEWVFNTSREVTINAANVTDPLGFEYSNVTNHNLNYLEKINYGLQARIGYGKFVLFGKYRMSDMFTGDFKSLVSSTELPRLIIGLEVGMHK